MAKAYLTTQWNQDGSRESQVVNTNVNNLGNAHKAKLTSEGEDNDPNKYYAYRKMRYDLSVPEFLGK